MPKREPPLTPYSSGPWTVEIGGRVLVRILDADDGVVIQDGAPGCLTTPDVDDVECKANLALIAAAPELAAALRKVTAELRDAREALSGSEFEVSNDDILEAEALLKRIDEGAP